MLYLWIKVFHVIFMVSWMAGLFYLPRLFVYHAEARAGDEPRRSILAAQFTHMERRLYNIIMNPAMMLTWTTGLAMVALQRSYLAESWLWLKVLLVVLLTVYHVICRKTIDGFERGTIGRSGEYYRAFNEGPTVALALIAALVIFKGMIGLSGLSALLVGTLVVIVVGFRAYAAWRRRHGEMVEGVGAAS